VSELLKYQIGITLIKGIGPNLAKNLIAYLGSVEAIFKEKEKTLTKIPGIGAVLSREIVSSNVMERAEKEIEFIQKNQIKPFFYTDKEYPYRLKECADSPIMLYFRGNLLNLNDYKFVSFVGTRSATESGKQICEDIIFDLSRQIENFVIVSGLAYGIDICAHKKSLDLSIPTIGILGHGLDRIYPSVHRSVAAKMVLQGGLLTEFKNGTNPDKQNFVQRNRIIAGLSDAVVVVESAQKGGALITAELANDYNRDVFAVPGRINDEFSAGCNLLIKQNKATLIESANDIVRSMNWETSNAELKTEQRSLFEDLTANEIEIIEILRQNSNGIDMNELVLRLQKPFNTISSLLLEMEFKNLVKSLPGNIYRLK
jgi:DNA processing protein